MTKEAKIQLISYVLIVILLLISGRIDRYITKYARFNFAYNYYFLKQLFHYVIFSIVGGLVGYNQFNKEKNTIGRWAIEGSKVAIVSVLPTFYVLRSIILVFAYAFQITIPFIFYATFSNVFLIGETQFENIMMTIWGFIVITSFKKVKNDALYEEVDS